MRVEGVDPTVPHHPSLAHALTPLPVTTKGMPYASYLCTSTSLPCKVKNESDHQFLIVSLVSYMLEQLTGQDITLDIHLSQVPSPLLIDHTTFNMSLEYYFPAVVKTEPLEVVITVRLMAGSYIPPSSYLNLSNAFMPSFFINQFCAFQELNFEALVKPESHQSSDLEGSLAEVVSQENRPSKIYSHADIIFHDHRYSKPSRKRGQLQEWLLQKKLKKEKSEKKGKSKKV